MTSEPLAAAAPASTNVLDNALAAVAVSDPALSAVPSPPPATVRVEAL